MDNEESKIMVPYIVHEGAMARSERHIKRLVVAIIILAIVILLNNVAWLYVWNSYEYISDATDVQIDNDGGDANYIGNDGDINNYGKDQSKSQDELPQEEER